MGGCRVVAMLLLGVFFLLLLVFFFTGQSKESHVCMFFGGIWGHLQWNCSISIHSVCLSVCLSIYLPIYLSICLSVTLKLYKVASFSTIYLIADLCSSWGELRINPNPINILLKKLPAQSFPLKAHQNRDIV